MRWFLYEDKAATRLGPIALTRPVFELICGRECLRRRLQRWFPASEWGVHIRPWLTEVYAEEHSDCSINNLSELCQSRVLLINGRWLPEERLRIGEVTLDNAGTIDGELAWIALEPEEAHLLTETEFDEVAAGIARSRNLVEASGTMISRPWDLVTQNPQQLDRDFADEGLSQSCQRPHVQILGASSDTYISDYADIDPYVVIDTRNGPVSIDRDVQIQSFTRIEGPCHVARGARVFRGQLRGGTTVGESCRVGGEIEECILHACVNKYHEGYLGHSYICPWVNLGAMSTTSDLKSDYSTVHVPIDGNLVDTEAVKVGSFIGDHTRTAIDSMFNTGTSIGIMSLIVPGGSLLPRHIPSYCGVRNGQLSGDWTLDRAIEAARAAMQRRDVQLTAAGETLLRRLHELTRPERDAALKRAAARRDHAIMTDPDE